MLQQELNPGPNTNTRGATWDTGPKSISRPLTILGREPTADLRDSNQGPKIEKLGLSIRDQESNPAPKKSSTVKSLLTYEESETT